MGDGPTQEEGPAHTGRLPHACPWAGPFGNHKAVKLYGSWPQLSRSREIIGSEPFNQDRLDKSRGPSVTILFHISVTLAQLAAAPSSPFPLASKPPELPGSCCFGAVFLPTLTFGSLLGPYAVLLLFSILS